MAGVEISAEQAVLLIRRLRRQGAAQDVGVTIYGAPGSQIVGTVTVAADNVLVNALLVGRIESEQWVRRAEAAGKSLTAFYEEMGAGLPMGRVGTADEFAAMALMLASEQGSYINGTAINVDGGLCPVT